MKKKIFLIVVDVILLSSIIMVGFSYAYNTLSFYSPFDYSPVYYYYDQQGNEDRSLTVAKGIVRWNISGANILTYVGTSTSNNIYIISGSYGNTYWSGSYAGQCSGPNILLPNSCVISLNDDYLYSSNYALNCFEHEMGHAYGLDHNNSTDAYGNALNIMYYQNNDYVLYPSSDDVSGVNSIY